MFNLVRQKLIRHKTVKALSPLILLFAIALWCVGLGWGIAFALAIPSDSSLLKSVDAMPSRYQTGRDLYLENCSGCHIAIPPEVMPTETWKQLLEKPQDHYGQSLTNLIRITQLLIWDYLNAYSRPLATREPVPLLVEQSRYFKALHPRVKFSEPVTADTCVKCHPGVAQFDYRTLTPEWQDSP
jgi:hypothetical protein